MDGSINLKLPDDIGKQMTDLWLLGFNDAINRVVEQNKTKRYLNVKESAEYMHVSPATFRSFLISPIEVGNVIRYDVKDLDEFYQQAKI